MAARKRFWRRLLLEGSRLSRLRAIERSYRYVFSAVLVADARMVFAKGHILLEIALVVLYL